MTEPEGEIPDWVRKVPRQVRKLPPNNQWEGISEEMMQQLRGQLLESILSAVVQAIRGLFVPGPFGSAAEQLEQWAQGLGAEIIAKIYELTGINLSSWDAFLESLSDGKGIDLPFVGNALNALSAFFGGIDWENPPSPGEVWRAVVAAFIQPLNLLLGPNSPLNPAKLNENLWPLGAFPSDSVAGGSGWTFDSSVTRTAGSTGSVKVVADGTMKALLGIPAAVVEDQQVDLSVFVKWADYVGTAAPIQLQVAEYSGVGASASRVGETVVVSLGPTTSVGGWSELAGTYTVPEGVDEIRPRLVVTQGATAGTFHFDDVVGRNKLILDWIANLPEQLQDLLGRIQALIDSVVQAFTGANSLGNKLEEFLFALSNIRPENIVGVLGPGTIGEAIEKLVDQLVSGIVGEDGEGAGLADLRELIEKISSQSWLGKAAFALLGKRDNKSLNAGLIRSERSNFNLSEINDSFTIAPGTARIAFDIIEESMPIGAISWIGWGIAGITEFYVYVYRIGNLNQPGGKAEQLWQSPNVVGVLEGTSSPGAYNRCPVDEPIAAEAGDLLAYVFVSVGGSHTIRGRSEDLPFDNSAAAPVGARGATHTLTEDPDALPEELTKDDIDWSNEVPWVGIAVDIGDGGAYRDPEQLQLNSATSLPIPNWCDRVDVIVLGKGGNAADGFAGFYGNAGSPGSYNEVTWVRGEHFTGTTILTYNGTAVSIPGFSVTGNNGANGVGQRLAVFGPPVGRGPGSHEYNGLKAVGGADQTTLGGNGTTPGGAANGGHWLGLYTQGGNGGKGRAWIQFRQEVVGEIISEPDDTPPDISGMEVEVVSSNTSSITLTISGAVDA
ncbi:minor tail protein [Mycobacterium phage TelAviv]|nr:minor tail protein [Mycobacterium phage TelAviv]